MNSYGRILYPPERVLAGLESGMYSMGSVANRVVEASTGRFVAVLVPGSGLSDALNQLPADPTAALRVIQTTPELQRLGPILRAMQRMGTLGALSSVATLGVCCVGFSVVLKRLSRMEEKLEETLAQIDILKGSIEKLHIHNDVLSVARLQVAGECLAEALASDSAAHRNELASQSRELFQEARAYHLELWKWAMPWSRLQFPVAAVLAMRGRFEAAALGELQARFIRGDLGAFRHAVKTVARDYESHYSFNPVAALRTRSDEACSTRGMGVFWATLPRLTDDLQHSANSGAWTLGRLRAFEDDAELPGLLSIAPHEVAAAARSVPDHQMGVLAAAL